jgi:DNA-binding response OmpR family regulator
MCAEWRGHAVGLTATEYKVVALLIAAAGVAVSYRTIYDAMRHKALSAVRVSADTKHACAPL